MPARTRPHSSGAMSARSTRSGASSRSAASVDSSRGFSASTRASSVSANNSRISSPATTDGGLLPAPTTTPVGSLDSSDTMGGAQSLNASLDALYAPTASYVNLVHADQMAQYLQAPETQQSLDTLLSVIKMKTPTAGHTDANAADADTDYHTALDELDYLEGLFKKLRFSYKEQLTKETVVRRILELELPLLSAADIDRMVRDTEAQRQALRQIKSEGHDQGAAAAKLIRDLAAERQYVTTAESEMQQLPDRVLRLRHRLARMKLALRAELAAIDDASAGAAPLPQTGYPCAVCGRSFYSAAFGQLHQAMHSLPTAAASGRGGGLDDGLGGHGSPTESVVVDFGSAAAAATAAEATALRRCWGCSQMVPAVLLDDSSAPDGESHKALHERIQRATAEAREVLAAAIQASSSMAQATLPSNDIDTALQGETEDVVRQLQQSEAGLAALEKRVRADAERQAAIEGEMTQSLQHLRESVGSIRMEMARIEQEADRMVQYIEEGRTYLGRSLQEQTDLFDVLLMGEDDDGDEVADEDEEMQDR